MRLCKSSTNFWRKPSRAAAKNEPLKNWEFQAFSHTQSDHVGSKTESFSSASICVFLLLHKRER